MKTHTFPQGSPEWLAIRMGHITASRCETLVTKTNKVSTGTGVQTLVNELVFETLEGQSSRDFSSQVTDRGNWLEEEAVQWYAWERNVNVEAVGFCESDDGRTGCSPDGLVGDDGVLEVKCPMGHTHIGYLRDHAKLVAAYRYQAQMAFHVTGRAWCDMLSFNPSPKIPNLIVRTEPDEKYLSALRLAIPACLSAVDEALEMIRTLEIHDDPVAALWR